MTKLRKEANRVSVSSSMFRGFCSGPGPQESNRETEFLLHNIYDAFLRFKNETMVSYQIYLNLYKVRNNKPLIVFGKKKGLLKK